MLAETNAIPPIRLRISCLKELLIASSVLVNPMSANEHNVVISQKNNIQTKLLESTIPYIALRKTNMRKKNHGLLSFSPAWCFWKSRMYPTAYTVMREPMIPIINTIMTDKSSMYSACSMCVSWAKVNSKYRERMT